MQYRLSNSSGWVVFGNTICTFEIWLLRSWAAVALPIRSLRIYTSVEWLLQILERDYAHKRRVPHMPVLNLPTSLFVPHEREGQRRRGLSRIPLLRVIWSGSCVPLLIRRRVIDRTICLSWSR